MENLFLKTIEYSLIKYNIMTSFLYYSMSSDLTGNEIIEIDNQTTKNRETVCLFMIYSYLEKPLMQIVRDSPNLWLELIQNPLEKS